MQVKDKEEENKERAYIKCGTVMDVGDATSTTSMDVVKFGLENQVGLEKGMI